MPAANDKRTKIFDTFVTLAPRGALVIIWPHVELDGPLGRLLDRLLGMMTYFGRAESWVEARLLDAWDGEPNATPVNGHEVDVRIHERTRVLATVPDDEYAEWQGHALRRSLDRKLEGLARDKGKDEAKVKLSKKEQVNVESSLPETIFDALHANTNDLRKAGWNRPPGSQWVDYLRPADAFVSKPARTRHACHGKKATVARFAVHGNVLPRLTETLWVGERVRTAVMSHSRGVAQLATKSENADAARVFSGKGKGGLRSLNGHEHAHFLCEAAAKSHAGRISHVTIFAPRGFGADDKQTLARFRKTWGHGGHDLQFVLLGIGQPEDFGGPEESAGQSRLLDAAAVWESRTPFVPTDHLRIRPGEAKDPKRREEAVRRELRRILRKEMERRAWLREHLALLDRVELLLDRDQCGTDLGGHFTTWLKFRRTRQRGNGHRGAAGGYGFRLTFKQPVRGPIVLGYGCHFGLGQFWALPSGH